MNNEAQVIVSIGIAICLIFLGMGGCIHMERTGQALVYQVEKGTK